MLWKRSSRVRSFRDQRRDAQTDLQRSEAVLQAVAEAVSSIDAEVVGLGRRVDELRAWVGGLIGPEDSSDGTRDERIDAELVDAERQLMQGVKRLADLAVIRSSYCGLQVTIAAERTRALQATRTDELGEAVSTTSQPTTVPR